MRRGFNRANFKFDETVNILTSVCRRKGKPQKIPKY